MHSTSRLSPRREHLALLAVALASVAVVLLAFEAYLRLTIDERPVDPGAGELRDVDGGRIQCPDPRVTRPYFAQRPRYPGCVFYPRNNVATRNLYDVERHRGEGRRVVGLGDSVVFGYGVDHEDTFLFLLQESMNDGTSADRVEVLNAAWPGNDLEAAFRVLIRRVLPIDPDLVVLGIHFNDFMEFPRVDVRASVDVPLRGQLRVVDHLAARWERKRSGDRNQRELMDSYDEGARARVFEQLLRFKNTLDRRGIPLLVLVFPVLFELESYPFRHVHADLGALLDAEGIQSIDFLPRFLGANAEDYWITTGDAHPNEKANRIFFEELRDQLAGPIGPRDTGRNPRP